MSKYIRFQVEDPENEDRKDEIIVFPRSINHDCMAEAMQRLKNQTWGNWKRLTRIPVSAGFVDSTGVCYGKSETLNLFALVPEDNELLRIQTLFQS